MFNVVGQDMSWPTRRLKCDKALERPKRFCSNNRLMGAWPPLRIDVRQPLFVVVLIIIVPLRPCGEPDVQGGLLRHDRACGGGESHLRS